MGGDGGRPGFFPWDEGGDRVSLLPHPAPCLPNQPAVCSDPALGLGQAQHRPAFSRGEVGRN